MDFDLPKDLQDYLDELEPLHRGEDQPIERRDDNIRFFDHRRENSAPTGTTRACRARSGRSCCPW